MNAPRIGLRRALEIVEPVPRNGVSFKLELTVYGAEPPNGVRYGS